MLQKRQQLIHNYFVSNVLKNQKNNSNNFLCQIIRKKNQYQVHSRPDPKFPVDVNLNQYQKQNMNKKNLGEFTKIQPKLKIFTKMQPKIGQFVNFQQKRKSLTNCLFNIGFQTFVRKPQKLSFQRSFSHKKNTCQIVNGPKKINRDQIIVFVRQLFCYFVYLPCLSKQFVIYLGFCKNIKNLLKIFTKMQVNIFGFGGFVADQGL
eukprot:TRINITY_DN2575_c0_g1_i15.p1 TRINITY_DN2575_c0_g1~~TRINITY_DN2575_c0_g1_i15.p1  ORF type:complete len:205 (-),score=-8.15 TRINITY_DN2575_c0_g1_i15:300-914(-)